MTHRERIGIITGILLIAAIIISSWMVASPIWKSALDNLYWTLAFTGSAWLAWNGFTTAEPHERRLRLALFAGAALIALGQLVWNVQVILGVHLFPAPADLLFLLAALVWILGWLTVLRGMLPRERVYHAILDIGAVLSALLAAILMLYIPHGHEHDIFTLIFLVLYPALFLTATGLTLLVIPALQLRLDRAHWLLLAGIAVYGFAWMQWHLLFFADALQPGMLFNSSYALGALLFGLGARNIRIIRVDNPGYRRRCEQAMVLMPLAALMIAIATLLFLFQAQVGLGSAHKVTIICAILGILLVSLRQLLVIGLLDRLYHAEMAILHNHDQLYRIANYDNLTGLANRQSFEDRLKHAVMDCKTTQNKLAVLLIDLDHFQQINDSFGHLAGDRLITEASKRFSACMDHNSSLARMGGDEFLVLYERWKSRTQVASLAVSVLESLQQPWQENSIGQQFITASIGISIYPDDAGNELELLRNADTALHQVKSSGRGTYRFYLKRFTEITQHKLWLRGRLHRALSLQEFVLMYQPQYDHKRQIVGLEALLRWQTNNQWIPPDEFIPLAEDTGLINAIGEWVFVQGCQDVMQWRNAGLQVPVLSINLSAKQLLDANIAKLFEENALSLGVSPTDITLEVTESQLFDQHLIPAALALQNSGFKLSIDDFGTGQSSLIKIKMLPIGEVKVDKTFVRDITTDTGDREICKSVYTLATALGMEVVAEGVETEEQFQSLVEIGYQRFQGWLFSKAVTSDVIADLLPSVDNETADQIHLTR